MGLFDSLLQQIKVEEADLAVFRKYPTIIGKVDELDESVSKWERWREKNWDDGANMTRNAVEAIRQRDEEIEALRAMQGGDVTWDDMKANVEAAIATKLAERKVATADEIKRAIESEVNPRTLMKQPDGREIPVTEYARNLERGIEITYGDSAHMPVQYFQEFGGLLKMSDLFKHMREKGIARLEDAYESY